MVTINGNKCLSANKILNENPITKNKTRNFNKVIKSGKLK